ncbi:hypothetical protein PoB_002494000 [Plakobranchus ocellatus]|uniref:Uncharacterized protein n=1 Tax=Plakobranchus ocellatus TaxID=259542 RepID=A0AAV3ZRP8_9GAST|nr:hypothetical protein PoB_002494000 [Plakobranchus ocellatus]
MKWTRIFTHMARVTVTDNEIDLSSVREQDVFVEVTCGRTGAGIASSPSSSSGDGFLLHAIDNGINRYIAAHSQVFVNVDIIFGATVSIVHIGK